MKNLRLLTSIYLVFVCIPGFLSAQKAPAIEWAKCYGGSNDESAQCVIQTSDGGYAIAGVTTSSDGDVSGLHGTDGAPDFLVMKFNASGNIEWQKCLGGSRDDVAKSIIQTSDGGYAIMGNTYSYDGDVSGYHSSDDIWVVKLNSTGNIEWNKCFGGSERELGQDIIQNSTGELIVIGSSSSTDGDVSGNHGSSDVWVAALSTTGILGWQHSYGGSLSEVGRSIVSTPDGGYVFTGYARSMDQQVTGQHDANSSDFWVVKIGSWGNIEWQKCFGGSGVESPYSVIGTNDGGFAIAGDAQSTDGDVLGKHGSNNSDIWVVKLSSSGSMEWQKCLGGTGTDQARSIIQTPDDGFIIAGATYGSADGDVSGNNGSNDVWVLKLNKTGTLEWQKCLGGSSAEFGNSIIQKTDGSLIVGAIASSSNGDVTGIHNYEDVWLVNLTTSASAETSSSLPRVFSLTTYPNPATKNLTLGYDLPKIAADVVISISDVTGRRIEELHVDGKLAGHNEIILDLSRYAAGTYYITVSVGDLSGTKAVEVVR